MRTEWIRRGVDLRGKKIRIGSDERGIGREMKRHVRDKMGEEGIGAG
jgi:hypothetical protein